MSHTKLKKKTKSQNGWTDDNWDKCKIIGDRAGAFVWLTNHTSEYYEKNEKYFEPFIIISAYLLGGGGIPSLVATDNLDLIRIVNGIIQGMVILLGIVKHLYQWMEYRKKIKKYGWASASYTTLFLEIEKTLNEPIEHRPKFNKFHTNIQKKEFSLQRKTPYIPESIIKDYYKTMGAHALKREVIFGANHNIDNALDPAETDSAERRRQLYNQTYYVGSPGQNIELNKNIRKTNFSTNADNKNYVPKPQKISEKRRYDLERYWVDNDY